MRPIRHSITSGRLGTLPALAMASLMVMGLAPDARAAAPAFRFTVAVDEAVTVDTTNGTPSIPIDVGGQTRAATYTSGSGSASLTFTYTATPGDLDLDGITVSSPIAKNGGVIADLAGNPVADADLAFTPPTTAGVKINYPSLSMDFTSDHYSYNGTVYNSFSAFKTASSATFTNDTNGTYFNNSGTLQKTSSANTPRLDYDPVTHAARGLLIEESRTNFLSRSAEFNNAFWSKSVLTVIADNATAPDGTLSADKITTNGGGLSYLSISGMAITSGQTYTQSVYAKADTSSNVIFENPTANFNVSLGTVVSKGAGVTATITNAGNGWYRLSASQTLSSSSTANVIYIDVYGTANAGKSVFLWGAQFEEGAFPSSYIATSSSSVTRAADVFTIPATGGWYDQAHGTALGDVSYRSSNTGSSYPMLWRFDDGTVNNRWNAYYEVSTQKVGFDAFPQTGSVFNSSPSATVKIAAATEMNNTRAAMDGTLASLKTTWTVPTVTRFDGQVIGASKWIRAFKYYPQRVSDTQLQLLTQ